MSNLQKNIVHADVKPNNILVDSEGHIVLTDFGCSEILKQESDHPAIGKDCRSKMRGTPHFIAPEIYNKQPYDYVSNLRYAVRTVNTSYKRLCILICFRPHCALQWRSFRLTGSRYQFVQTFMSASMAIILHNGHWILILKITNV